MISIPGYEIHKKVISSPSISLYEGLRINDGAPALFCLVHASPFNQDAIAGLKNKLIRIKDLHAPCVPEILEIRDHSGDLLQIYRSLSALSLPEVLPQIKGSIEKFLETAIQLGESLEILHRHDLNVRDAQFDQIIQDSKAAGAFGEGLADYMDIDGGFFDIGSVF